MWAPIDGSQAFLAGQRRRQRLRPVGGTSAKRLRHVCDAADAVQLTARDILISHKIPQFTSRHPLEITSL